MKGATASPRTSIGIHGLTPALTMVVVAFVSVFALGVQLRVDTDVWWHLRAGALTLDDGIIRSDPFSFTRSGEPWIDHSWGSEVISYALWTSGGYGALEILTGLLAVAAAVLLYLMCSGGTYLKCCVVGLASVTASIFWAPRPQMFSYTLAALVLYLLYLHRYRRTDILWLLPFVMLLWANLHGGYVIGLVLIAGVLVGETLERFVPLDDRGALDGRSLRRLAVFGALSVGAVLVNPYGPRLLTVPLDTAGGSFVGLIEEWAPPDLRVASFWPFALMLVLFVLSVGASPKRLGWSDGLLCSVAVLSAITAGRNVSVLAVVLAPVIAYHVSAIGTERGWGIRPLREASVPIAIANVVIIACVALIAADRASSSVRDSTFERTARQTLPVDAVEYLRAHRIRGNLFNSYDWGGYIVFTLPEVPVFVDGRSDLYGDFLVDPYLLTAEASPGWDRRLERYGIGTVLVRRTGGLANALAGSSEWRWVYSDELAVIFERR